MRGFHSWLLERGSSRFLAADICYLRSAVSVLWGLQFSLVSSWLCVGRVCFLHLSTVLGAASAI